MRILQVGSTDLQGARFNGHDLHLRLRARGEISHHCVWDRHSTDPDTWQLTGRKLNGIVNGLERALSLQSIVQPFAFQLLAHPTFRAADVVHYQLLHAGFFSLFALPALTRARPAVWTLHDPWALTGHCVHPKGCERWKTGCGSCPDLTSEIPLKTDRTALLWRAKRRAYAASRFHVVVASRWMRDLVAQSPLLQNVRVHEVPFGVDRGRFKPLDQAAARAALGIAPENFVIVFRSTRNEFKGLPYVREALERMRGNRPITLIALEKAGLVDDFKGRMQVIEPGWITDEELLARHYAAADVLLMPSLAESFGMMAIEAMACARPVVTFEGTAVPAVIHAPEAGVAVPHGDAAALAAALDELMADPARTRRLGERAHAIAAREYDVERHVARMLEVYAEVAAAP